MPHKPEDVGVVSVEFDVAVGVPAVRQLGEHIAIGGGEDVCVGHFVLLVGC